MLFRGGEREKLLVIDDELSTLGNKCRTRTVKRTPSV